MEYEYDFDVAQELDAEMALIWNDFNFAEEEWV